MAMIVQHNITAMNANRNLNVTTAAQAKSTEKLSTGYKINRAADDAAGLSISEKMRRQIRGLTQATANAQDGISAVQTAEGALTEVHDMLQRMDELATKAANGSLSENDRQNVQDELDSLLTEIDRISETTKFNETYLLKGDPTVDNQKTINLKAHDAGLQGVLETDTSGKKATFTMDALEEGQKINIGGTEYTVSEAKDGSMTVDQTALNTATLDAAYSGDGTYTYDAENSKWKNGNTELDAATLAALTVTNAEDGDTIEITKGTAATKTTATEKTTSAGDKTGATLKFTYEEPTSAAMADAQNALASYLKDTGAMLATNDDGTVKVKSIDLGSNFSTDVSTTPVASGGTVDVKATIDGVSTKIATITIGGTLSSDKVDTAAVKTTGADTDVAASYIAGTDATAEYKDANPKMVGENILTKNDAYKLIAAELKKANDIGAGASTKSTVPEKTTADVFSKAVTSDDGITRNLDKITFDIELGSIDVQKSLQFELHVGSDADMTNKIGIKIESMDSTYLGIKDLDVVGDGNDGGTAATYAIDAIEDAIKKVSEQRSALGAVQNRLEHTVKNLDNVVENTSAAESEIRDTNMATEMVAYSKNNILAQAGQSMLAQANQSNQGILSLLG